MSSPLRVLSVPKPGLDAHPARRPSGRQHLRLLCAAGTLALLSACASHAPQQLSESQEAARYAAHASGDYSPPGPPEDPWGPYIMEASARFDVPDRWIREVMRVESGGRLYHNDTLVTSPVGAMGLMQVMPATFDDMRGQFNGIGGDPYDPHNSILAGTAYIRQMYDRYGSPGFLAAYNAGPQRMDNYLAGSGSLPNETVNYVASIGPHLGGATPGGASAPVMMAAVTPRPGRGRRASGCVRDPDAAYDSPCGTVARPPDPQPVEVAAAPAPRWAPPAYAPASNAGCVRDPDAAYDSPCGSAPAPMMVVAVRPTSPGCVRDPDAAYDSPCGSARPAPVLVAASEPVASAIYSPAPSSYAPPSYAPPSYAQRPYTPPSYGPPPYAPRPSPQQVADIPLPPARPGVVSPVRPDYGAARGGAAGSYTMPALVARAEAAPFRAPRAPAPARFAAAPAARAVPVMATGGSWGIQVGAFATRDLARSTAESARRAAPSLLGAAQTRVAPTTPFGGVVLYRARLVGVGALDALEACARVQRQGTSCLTVAPGA